MKKIILVLVILILTGCGHDVTSNEYEKAVELCKNYGGVAFIVPIIKPGAEVRCGDGTYITFSMPKK